MAEFGFGMQNAELFTLTYGAIVRQLLTDYEEIDEVNKQLDTMYVTTIIDCIPLFFFGCSCLNFGRHFLQ